MALVALVPIVLLGVSLRSRMNADLAAAERDFEQRLDVAARDVTGYVSEHQALLRSAAVLPQVVAMDAAAMPAVLRAIQGRHPDLSAFQVVNTEGSAVARGDTVHLPHLADRAWFKDVIAGKEVAHQTIISRSSGKPSLAISTRVVEGNEIVGVAEATLDLASPTEIADQVHIGRTG